MGKLRNLYYCNIDDNNQNVHNGIQLDIFLFTKNNILNIIPTGIDIFDLNLSNVFTLKELYFENIKVFVQNNYKDFLKQVYSNFNPDLLPIDKHYTHKGRIGPTLN